MNKIEEFLVRITPFACVPHKFYSSKNCPEDYVFTKKEKIISRLANLLVWGPMTAMICCGAIGLAKQHLNITSNILLSLVAVLTISLMALLAWLGGNAIQKDMKLQKELKDSKAFKNEKENQELQFMFARKDK